MVLADYITITHGPTKKDITNYLIQVEDINFIGTDESRSASFTLNAKFGNFITESNGGDTPILDFFDLIKIETNVDGNKHGGIFEITGMIPSGDGSGKTLTIQAMGREYQLQKKHYSKSYRWASAFDIVRDIGNFWNYNKGTAQPMIIGHDVSSITIGNDTIKTNQAPKWTAHDFSFKQQPTCFEVLNVLADRLGSSRVNQGAGRFYEFYFEDHPTLDNVMIIKFFPSGIEPTVPVTVQSDTLKPISLRRADLKKYDGNVIVAKGAASLGSIPEGHVRYWSSKEWFDLHPHWISGETYPDDVFVQYNDIHYKSNKQTTQTPSSSATDWDVKTVADEIKNTVYSLWTYKKAISLFKNSGTNPNNTPEGNTNPLTHITSSAPGFIDANSIVRENKYYRNYCNLQTNTSLFDTDYKYGKLANGEYRGIRLLVDPNIGTLSGAFAQNNGKDSNHKSFAYSLVIHNGGKNTGTNEYRNWTVVKTYQNDYESIIIKSTGKTLKFNSSTNTFVEIVGATLKGLYSEAIHYYESIQNDMGIGKSSKQKGDGTWVDLDNSGVPDTNETYGTDSAVKITYAFNIFDFTTSGTNNYNAIGCWLGLEWPLPCNTCNSITESVGQIYGGNSTKKEPATLDVEGFFGLTPNGDSGYNKSNSNEMSRQSDSLDFWCKFKWEDAITLTLPPNQAEFNWRCYAFDTFDNVFYADFTIKDNDIGEQISLNISQFKEYLGRRPTSTTLNSLLTILPELELRRIFEWRNLKYLLFQFQEVYDDHGRFIPSSSRLMSVITASRLSFWLDDLRLANQMIATSGPDTTRALEPRIINRPTISNIRQLEQDLVAEKEIHKFPFKAWEITQARVNDIDFGELFYYTDSDLVVDNDDGRNNCIKLVAKEVHYSGIKSLRRRLVGVKILT